MKYKKQFEDKYYPHQKKKKKEPKEFYRYSELDPDKRAKILDSYTEPKSHPKDKKPNKPVWTPEDQALEDILWAS